MRSETAEAVKPGLNDLQGGTACPPSYCLRATEPDRHAVPVLTVLPLLTGEHLEEGEWVEKTRVQTSGSGRHPGGSFFALVEREGLGIQSQSLEDRAAAEFSPKPVAEIVVPQGFFQP